MNEIKTKRSKTLIFLASFLAILTIIAIAIAFILNYNIFAPQKLVILDDGQNIYLSTNINDNYKGYRFKFTDAQGKQILFDCDNNQISANDLLAKNISLGQTYSVSVCYLAENEGNNSAYSDAINWTCKTYLEMPKISFDSVNNVVTWQEIEGATFYRVYINGEQDFVDTNENKFDLKQTTPGQKNISVVAYSNNSNYMTSAQSKLLQINFVYYYKPFTTIQFDLSSKIITAKSNDLYEKVRIYLDGQIYEATKFNVNHVGQEYTYFIDITTIYNGQEFVGISPVTIDEYHVYNGLFLYYQVEN